MEKGELQMREVFRSVLCFANIWILPKITISPLFNILF